MNAIRLTWEDKSVNLIAVLVSLLLLVVTAYPLYYVLINSLNDGADAASGNIYWYPRHFSLENYELVFKQNYLITGLMMSVARTVVGTIAAILVTAMAAYALTKEKLKFRKLYLMLCIVTMYFSGGLIPLYFVLNELYLLDNFLVYILPSLFTFFHCLLFMAFFRELPKELFESAYMDGANEFFIFFKIVIPLSMPVVATISLFVGVHHWNDYFIPSFFVSQESLQTLPVILIRLLSLSEAQQQIQQYLGNHQSKVTMESLRYATLFISILPITLLYPLVQRFFVKGMLVGSIKA
jgi:putative aldouronate transport system permease protein